MLKVNCSAADNTKLRDLVPFQGDLKKRRPKDIEELMASLKDEGMMMPFAVWLHNDKKYLLDGHGRLEAMTRLSFEDPTLLDQDFPCIVVEAADEDAARKALLQITSSYGHVSKTGIVAFTATIPEYHAPVIDRTLHVRHRIKKEVNPNNALIRLSVPQEKAEEVKKLLSQVPYVKVL